MIALLTLMVLGADLDAMADRPTRAGVELRFAAAGGRDISGRDQAGEAGTLLGQDLTVMVTADGAPAAGLPVRFRVLSEPPDNRSPDSKALLGDTLVATDRFGIARTPFRLGATPGQYRVEASAGGREVVFAATGLRRRWYLVTLVGLLGGLCLFLFGLHYGSKGLRRLAGGRLRQMLFSLTSNRILGALAGVVVTVVFQSSGATSALLVGLASAGILTLGQALGVILGADIGTTITVQVLAFRVFDYALVIAVAGFVMMSVSRRLRNAGQAVFGFGLVFFSLKVVLAAAEPMTRVPAVMNAVAALGGNVWFGLVFALLFTALVRSSAATIGIVVGLSFSGLVDLPAAVPFILGANIGTGFSAVLASWRAGIEARRIAVGHVLFKVAIVGICLPFLPALVRLVAATASDVPRQVANAHTLINLAAFALFLPLLTPYRRLLEHIVRPRPGERYGPRYIEPGALDAPELAVAQATREVLRMGDRVQRMYLRALEVFVSRDKTGRREVVRDDDRVDRLETGINSYLARISQQELSFEVSRRTVALFYITDALENIADVVSKSLMAYVRKSIDQGLVFSEQGLADIGEFHGRVADNLAAALACVATWDPVMAARVARCKEWGNARQRELQDRHLGRLGQELKETLDTSSIHLDFIADLERINFHCSQIGIAVLEAVDRRR